MMKNINKKIRKLGLANFHTYQEETFNTHGNILMFKADNGTGKTAVMTALYPTIFTMDLNDSLNFGKGLDRKGKEFVKDDTYIFGVFENNNGPYSIVLNFTLKQNGDVKKKALILNTTEFKVTRENGETIPLNEFEKTYKQNITNSFTISKHYQEWVAKNIFGTSLDKFKMYIKVGHQSAGSTKEAKSKFNVFSLIQAIKDSLDKIANDNTLSSIISTYANRQIAASEKQTELNKKVNLNNVLAEQRSKQNKENTKVVEDINKVQKNMSKELTTLELNLEKSDEKLNELETELDELETTVKDLKNQKDDYSIKLQEVEREIIRLDIDAKKETLNQELKFIQDKIKQTTKALNKEEDNKIERENELSKLNNKITNLNEQKETLGEITPLPFEINEWNTIEDSYKLYESTLNEQRDLTSELNATKANYTKELSEKNNLTIKINEETLRYNKEIENYYIACNEQPQENESLESFKNRLYEKLTYDISELNSSINILNKEKKDNEKYLKELQQSTKPETHFISENAIPLFEIIDFKENVDNDTKERIETLLQMSGLLELLVEENNTDKGLILCKN